MAFNKKTHLRQNIDALKTVSYTHLAFDIAFESVGYVDIPFRCLDVVMSHKLFHNLCLLYTSRCV